MEYDGSVGNHVPNLVVYVCRECGQFYALPAGTYIDVCACNANALGNIVIVYDGDSDPEDFERAKANLVLQILAGVGVMRMWVGSKDDTEISRPTGKNVIINK